MSRDEVKLALLIMINAPSRKSALRALAAELARCEPRRQEAARMLDAVQRHFAALEPLWCSGIGLRLQRIDSDICKHIQGDMRSAGLPVLSIHDSFISWRRAETRLRAVMQEAFRQIWKIGIKPWRSGR